MSTTDLRVTGIMQPYFFPYWGHYALIARTQEWVVFDECQYKPKSWMNRNRILHPREGWQYITASLANSSRNIKISQALLQDSEASKRLIMRQMYHYKKQAPYFSDVMDIVEKAFSFVDEDKSLTSLCIGSLSTVCQYLGIVFNPIRSSSLKLTYPCSIGAGEWAPFICSRIGARAYINPASGAHLFEKSSFLSRNINFMIFHVGEYVYKQGSRARVQNLSILDTAMWFSPAEIREAMFKNSCIRPG